MGNAIDALHSQKNRKSIVKGLYREGPKWLERKENKWCDTE